MPYKIQNNDGKFEVVKESDGKVMGTHPTRAKAQAQMEALYANEKLDTKSIKAMADMGGKEYAMQECWDIQQAANVLAQVAALCVDEMDEPLDMMTLCDIINSLIEFIRGEVKEMESASSQTVPAVVKSNNMNLSYAKSLGVNIDLSVKYVARDEIKGYTFIWGHPEKYDVEKEYFTKETDFWDQALSKSRPLTWDHAQDGDLKASPIIGQITDFGDDDVGRWYVAKMDRAHRYRKAIDALIANGALGTSSDSAPQYITRVKTGKSTWLKEWAWFASALTDCPAEPRTIDSLEFLKSIGVTLPETRATAWEWNKNRLALSRLKS